MRFPETCLDLQPLSEIENTGFPAFLVPTEWRRTLGPAVLSPLNFSAESSVQTHSQPKCCLLPPKKCQAAEEEHFICWLPASSFRGKGSSVGNGRRIYFISLCIFKHRSWHCCNYHPFLHWPRWAATKPAELPVTLHHFIFTVLLWGLAGLE